jgi:hypothetical protein
VLESISLAFKLIQQLFIIYESTVGGFKGVRTSWLIFYHVKISKLGRCDINTTIEERCIAPSEFFKLANVNYLYIFEYKGREAIFYLPTKRGISTFSGVSSTNTGTLYI